MDFIIDFLVNNYMWFLVITIFLLFALIGYIVDSKEQKDLSIFDSPQDMARHLESLAKAAENKTIGEVMQNVKTQSGPVANTIVENPAPVSNAAMNGNMGGNPMSYTQPSNPQPMMQQTMTSPNAQPANTSFEVLGK